MSEKLATNYNPKNMRLFIKTYEDNASGKLSDERFEMLSQTYEAEQKELEEEILRLEKEIEVQL